MNRLLAQFKIEELSAHKFRTGGYGIRPAGCLGTMGWKDGKPWEMVYSRTLPHGVKVEE